MDDVTTIELDIRRNGADYRVKVVIAPNSVTNWVERLGPRKRHYSLMLMPMETGHMWAYGMWHYEAIGEAPDQFDTTLEAQWLNEGKRP